MGQKFLLRDLAAALAVAATPGGLPSSEDHSQAAVRAERDQRNDTTVARRVARRQPDAKTALLLIFLSKDERMIRRKLDAEEAMAEVPNWRLTGDWFDVCRCRVPCGCTFAQPPDENQCDGILAWHIREGGYGDVNLDGLTVVMVGSFEGNLWTGEAKNSVGGFFFDERADESQREALEAIWSGQAGGWPAGFAELMEEVLGIEFAPIDFELADDLARWRVEVPGKVMGSAEALTGPTTPEGARVQVHNAPGAEVGPGQVATWGTANEDEVDAFGLKWSWPGRSSKHFPFDWTGPDQAAA